MDIAALKYRIILFGGLLFIALFAFLQWTNAYHFFFIEQNQLFLFSRQYIGERFFSPGGFSLLSGEFLVQFFIIPYVGAVITALLLAKVGVLTAFVCKRIAPAAPLYILYFLPVLTLLFMHFNFNYWIQGTVAYIFFLLFVCLYLRIAEFKYRLLYALLSVPLLYWWGGSIACLYAVCLLLWETLNRPKGWYWTTLVVFEAMLIAFGCMYFSVLGEYRFAFFPDFYYHRGLSAPDKIYFSWIALPFVIIISYLLRDRKPVSRKREFVESFTQVILIIGLAWFIIPQYDDAESLKLKELDYYTRTRQWDKIIENCKGRQTNYLYLCHLNMALAEKGVLADQAFVFDQHGVQGLFVSWNKTVSVSTLLSELHFTIGNMVLAQEKAFESYVSSMGYGNPRMLQRLVQTNLIYGEYAVAEKYLDVLEQTFYYADWAKEHRRFLYNDVEVENDSLLGEKRKGLVDDNFLSNPAKVELDLLSVANQYPQNRTPIEYVGVGYLLMKELNAFEHLLNTCYNTDVLRTLPVSFQEAVIILYESSPEIWAHYNVSESIVKRFAEYKRLVKANRGGGATAELNRLFGNTYWYYFMYK
jgi:hypothetical protein